MGNKVPSFCAAGPFCIHISTMWPTVFLTVDKVGEGGQIRKRIFPHAPVYYAPVTIVLPYQDHAAGAWGLGPGGWGSQAVWYVGSSSRTPPAAWAGADPSLLQSSLPGQS